jgi:heavy metal sensor kinase
VGRDLGPDLADIHNLLLLLTGIGCTVFALGLTGGWILSRRSVRPIRKISKVAAEISEQDLSARIDGSEMDLEFEELSTTLNDTFDRLETAFQQQVQFTADASHELRTPLSVIRMHQELALSKQRSAKEYRAALETCQRSTARMTSLVESLLSLSRLDANGQHLRLQKENLADIVDEVVQATRLLAKAKRISVRSETVPALINGDRGRLGQVLTNLITNAIAYTADGGLIEVSIAVDGDHVVTAVADSGEGIAEEHLSRIFDRFYRVESERSREIGGSGLGLAICKAIVEAHGGTILVESTVGAGSVFSVQLPRMPD